MDQKVVDFLSKERMAVLVIVLPDGTPHTAAMHFVYKNDAIYFSTHAKSKKVEGLTSAKASVTIGFSEQNWVTLQMNGSIEKTESVKDLILTKYPESAKYMDEKIIFLKFTSSWWRFTDFTTQPPTIVENL